MTVQDGRTRQQIDGVYNRLPITCDLSITSLEECAMRLQPSRKYTLYVNPACWSVAVTLIRLIGAAAPEHPFAPQLNLYSDQLLEKYEWYICDNQGNAWGSEGV